MGQIRFGKGQINSNIFNKLHDILSRYPDRPPSRLLVEGGGGR